jgi:hypothetical protein
MAALRRSVDAPGTATEAKWVRRVEDWLQVDALRNRGGLRAESVLGLARTRKTRTHEHNDRLLRIIYRPKLDGRSRGVEHFEFSYLREHVFRERRAGHDGQDQVAGSWRQSNEHLQLHSLSHCALVSFFFVILFSSICAFSLVFSDDRVCFRAGLKTSLGFGSQSVWFAVLVHIGLDRRPDLLSPARTD